MLRGRDANERCGVAFASVGLYFFLSFRGSGAWKRYTHRWGGGKKDWMDGKIWEEMDGWVV